MKRLLVLLAFLPLLAFGATSKSIRGDYDKADTSAINQNFDRINRDLSNTVNKTGTQTITGPKTFDGPVVVSSLTVDGSMNLHNTGTVPDMTVNEIRTRENISATISNNSTGTIHSIASSGMGRVLIFNSGNGNVMASSLFAFRNVATQSCYSVASAGGFTVNVSTSDVTGTTGTVSTFTISAHDGIVEVENRSGDSVVIRYVIEAY